MDDEQNSDTRWDELIGPCIDAAGVAERLEASPREVARLTGAGHLLALTTDEATVYPLFQFTDMDWRSMGLYLWAMGYHRSSAGRARRIAAWLRLPHPQLDGRTPVEVIRENGPDGALLRLAGSASLRFLDDPASRRSCARISPCW